MGLVKVENGAKFAVNFTVDILVFLIFLSFFCLLFCFVCLLFLFFLGSFGVTRVLLWKMVNKPHFYATVVIFLTCCTFP